MKIVIDIPEKTLKYYATLANKGEQIGSLERIVLNGTQLKEEQDCISREEAMKIVFPYCDGDLIADDIKHLPSVTPSRPKARLIRKTGRDWNDYYECSNCQACNELVSSLSAQYCFKCGAKIEKRESIEDTVLDSNTNQFEF